MYLVYHFSKKLTSLIDLAQLTVKIILLYFKYRMLINLHLFGFQSRIVSSQTCVFDLIIPQSHVDRIRGQQLMTMHIFHLTIIRSGQVLKYQQQILSI